MNERIRELVRQAGLDDADFPIEDWDNVPLSKFAELIIKESYELFTDPYEAYSGAYIHLKIKQHFGVEE